MSALDFLPSPPFNHDDRFAAVNVAAGGAETTVVRIDTRIRTRAFVCFMANHTDADPADIVWNLKANGAALFPYQNFSVQVGEISRPSDLLPWPIEVPSNAVVELTAKNNGGASSVCSGRLQIFYTETV